MDFQQTQNPRELKKIKIVYKNLVNFCDLVFSTINIGIENY